MLFFILSGSAEAVPLIGTCYGYNYLVKHVADQNFVDSTHIKSFRHGYDWGSMEKVMSDNAWGFPALVNAIADYYPPMDECGEKIFVLNFWHPTKMLSPGGEEDSADFLETWRVHPSYEDDFYYFCHDLAYYLHTIAGVNWFILHNEPDLYYGGGSNWRNWKSSPADFADQCRMAAEAIKDAVPYAYAVYGAFANEDPATLLYTPLWIR